MFLAKLKLAGVFVLLVSIAAAAASLACQLSAAPEPQGQSGKPRVPAASTPPTEPSIKAAPKERFGDSLPPGALARLGEVGLRHEGVRQVAWTPDGKALFSASVVDKTVRLWDLGSGKEVRAFEGHTGGVWSIALSADGKKLVSGSSDGTARLWDVGA